MDTKKQVISGIVLFFTLIALFFLVRAVYERQLTKGYTHAPTGFFFPYNHNFRIEEKEHEGGFLVVTLLSRSTTSPITIESEPAIQCVFFKNTDQAPLSSLITTEQYTSLVGRVIEGTTYPSVDIPGTNALGFKTDGLYASDHVAFEQKGYMIDCSVGYISLDDPLRMTFVTFLSRIKLSSE